MPQLDFTIVFSQIFWLILIFFILYIFVTHYFLPFFIKNIKSRKKILEINTNLILDLRLKLNLKHKNLEYVLVKNLECIKIMLQKKIYPFFNYYSKNNLILVDEKLAKIIYYNTIYFDENIFNSVLLKPLFLNFK